MAPVACLAIGNGELLRGNDVVGACRVQETSSYLGEIVETVEHGKGAACVSVSAYFGVSCP